MIAIKRAYDPVLKSDGRRFLVDHLRPRGLKKEALKVEAWVKAVSPSNQLRNWFKHDPVKWSQFKCRYFAELNKKPKIWQPLLPAAKTGEISLVFGTRDTEHNNATALKAYLEKKLKV